MKNPIFTLPPIAEIARNALAAHAEDRLQATSTRHSGKSPAYYHCDTKCSCAIGASMPREVACALDKQEYSAIHELVDFAIVVLPGGKIEQARYLQRLHDRVVTMRMHQVAPARLAEEQKTLLDYLKKLAGGRP